MDTNGVFRLDQWYILVGSVPQFLFFFQFQILWSIFFAIKSADVQFFGTWLGSLLLIK